MDDRQNDIVRGGGEVKKNISLPRWMNFFPNPTRWREKSREQGHVVGEIRELSQVILTRKSRAICTSKHVPRRSRSEVHRNFRKRTSSKKARKFRCFLLCACFPRSTAAVPQNAARALFLRALYFDTFPNRCATSLTTLSIPQGLSLEQANPGGSHVPLPPLLRPHCPTCSPLQFDYSPFFADSPRYRR